MAVAMTDTVLNYSGLLHTKTNDSTRLLNAVNQQNQQTSTTVEEIDVTESGNNQ